MDDNFWSIDDSVINFNMYYFPNKTFFASLDVCPSFGIGHVDNNFNIGHNLNTTGGRAFIFHMCIPYYKTFHMVP